MTKTKTRLPSHVRREHVACELPDSLLRFSFVHWQSNRKFRSSTGADAASYLDQLLRRFQALSTLQTAEFRTAKDKSLRAHRHRWDETTEPDGFSHLPEAWRELEAWQFQLSANKHGRVHGILVDEVPYVVWLDPEHRLYQ